MCTKFAKMGDRHTIRAGWHDYNEGIYFITICSHNKQHIFGTIVDGEMVYSTPGEIVNQCLSAIPNHHNDVELLNYVVMPNHIHVVIAVRPSNPPIVGAQYFAPNPAVVDAPNPAAPNTGCLKSPRHDNPYADNHFNSRLAVIARSFKAACSIEINRQIRAQWAQNDTQNRVQWAQSIAPLPPVWQRNYYEHIIRDQHTFENIMAYIDNNVVNWAADCFRDH